jgi:hypothetical protein
VLNALLQGTAYDYVIVGAPGAPQQITHILLAAHNEGGGGEAEDSEPAHGDQPGANLGGVQHRHGMQMLSPRQPPSEDASAEEDDSTQPAPQPEVQPQPDQQQPQQNQTKTPEDLFRELQQLGQPPSQQNPPPK